MFTSTLKLFEAENIFPVSLWISLRNPTVNSLAHRKCTPSFTGTCSGHWVFHILIWCLKTPGSGKRASFSQTAGGRTEVTEECRLAGVGLGAVRQPTELPHLPQAPWAGFEL